MSKYIGTPPYSVHPNLTDDEYVALCDLWDQINDAANEADRLYKAGVHVELATIRDRLWSSRNRIDKITKA